MRNSFQNFSQKFTQTSNSKHCKWYAYNTVRYNKKSSFHCFRCNITISWNLRISVINLKIKWKLSVINEIALKNTYEIYVKYTMLIISSDWYMHFHKVCKWKKKKRSINCYYKISIKIKLPNRQWDQFKKKQSDRSVFFFPKQ